MDLRTSVGWRRLGLSTLIVFAPLALSMITFLVLDIQGFMYSGWAIWVLIASLLIPYSIAYTADLLRRREARRGEDLSGDSSPLVFTEASSGEASLAKSSALDSSPRSDTVWIWVGLASLKT
jgi:hypothetical protein